MHPLAQLLPLRVRPTLRAKKEIVPLHFQCPQPRARPLTRSPADRTDDDIRRTVRLRNKQIKREGAGAALPMRGGKRVIFKSRKGHGLVAATQAAAADASSKQGAAGSTAAPTGPPPSQEVRPEGAAAFIAAPAATAAAAAAAAAGNQSMAPLGLHNAAAALKLQVAEAVEALAEAQEGPLVPRGEVVAGLMAMVGRTFGAVQL